MHWFRDLPIRRKLSLATLLISNITALLACAMFGAYDWVTFRQTMAGDLGVLADVLAANSTAALTFDDRANAEEILKALRVRTDVLAACLYGREQRLFARYVRGGAAVAAPPPAGEAAAWFDAERLHLMRPIMLDGRRIGTIYLEANLSRLYARLRLYASIAVIVLLASLLVAAALSTAFQRAIARPLLDLARTARRISVDKNYAVRASKEGEDEIGQLTDRFNQMVAAIEERDLALRRSNEALEAEVAVRRRAEDELRALNETLEQRVTERTAVAEKASRAKSEFLANMSHELRTPLNSVIGFTNLLLKNRGGNLRPEDLTFMERIVANGRHLLALINQALDLSKIEARKVDLRIAPVALDEMVRHTLAEFEGQVQGKDVRLCADVPEGLVPLETDEEKLRQVLVNLVGNAVKFTEHGCVLVGVEVDPATRRPTAISVNDTGIGIPADQQALIFEAFRQADSTTARKYGGTGLGLTISQALCRLMGHRIEVCSELGRGSAFRIVLGQEGSAAAPTAEAGKAATVTVERPDATVGQERLVVVIDAEKDARIVLSRMFEELGCRVLPAASGEEGVRLAHHFRPHLVTLALLMPQMDGWSVLAALREDTQTRAIPAVVISIVALENRHKVAGAADVLQKPVTRDDLIRVLRQFPPPTPGT